MPPCAYNRGSQRTAVFTVVSYGLGPTGGKTLRHAVARPHNSSASVGRTDRRVQGQTPVAATRTLISLRAPRASEWPDIHNVVQAAFGQQDEAKLVDMLRDRQQAQLTRSWPWNLKQAACATSRRQRTRFQRLRTRATDPDGDCRRLAQKSARRAFRRARSPCSTGTAPRGHPASTKRPV